ncbi:MAG: SDR family oxidoreductase [Bdellovibrionaceae bacterium]|nr:SDR family oxidoreductase [Bdellovibrionales bacterium]MCB9083516.1 SDR family oxidoreductase [Pseudobdellovibrionaceae bacterium]
MAKTALITGAGSGIGQAIAQAYSKAGYEVWLLGRNPKKLEATAQSLDGPAQVFPCDLADLDQVEKMGKSILSSVGSKGLNALIHNAGLIKRATFLESTRNEWQESFRVHLLGPVLLTQALLPLLEKAAPSAIVNVSSTLGHRPVPGTASYSALKSAVINWTLSLAVELADRGIHANCVCPGIVDTPIHGTLSEDQRNYLDKLQPLGRVGTAEEVARAVYFLGSGESSWTTGSVLNVDGGISLV